MHLRQVHKSRCFFFSLRSRVSVYQPSNNHSVFVPVLLPTPPRGDVAPSKERLPPPLCALAAPPRALASNRVLLTEVHAAARHSARSLERILSGKPFLAVRMSSTIKEKIVEDTF